MAVGAQQIPLPPGSLALTTPEGQRCLLEADQPPDYFSLSARFETQETPANCGPASAVMVLNALGIPAPPSAVHRPFQCFEQSNFFSPQVEQVLSRERLQRQGATLEELGSMLACWGLQVTTVEARPGGLDEFRRAAREAVRENRQALVVNFLRRPLQQQGGGHFCPLAAYHPGSDRFLVMDVARYKYPPFWVGARVLFAAMQTPDSSSGKNRGYLVLTAPEAASP